MVTGREELKRRVRERLGKAEKKPEQRVPWKQIAIVLVGVVIAGLVLWLRPWGGAGLGEKVRFDYRAMFTYWGSEDNGPLDNLVLKWSALKIENSFIEETYLTWELYYVENDNSLTLQANALGIRNLRGTRSSQLGVYSFGHENERFGPVLNAWIDRLYPREVFLDLGYVMVDKERAGNLTFRVYGQTDSAASWQAFGQENKRIDFSLTVGLYRENILVERFGWTQENGPSASYWLWPS